MNETLEERTREFLDDAAEDHYECDDAECMVCDVGARAAGLLTEWLERE